MLKQSIPTNCGSSNCHNLELYCNVNKLGLQIVPAFSARCQQLKLLQRLQQDERQIVFRLNLDFVMNSCNLCEAALPARIKF